MVISSSQPRTRRWGTPWYLVLRSGSAGIQPPLRCARGVLWLMAPSARILGATRVTNGLSRQTWSCPTGRNSRPRISSPATVPTQSRGSRTLDGKALPDVQEIKMKRVPLEDVWKVLADQGPRRGPRFAPAVWKLECGKKSV